MKLILFPFLVASVLALADRRCPAYREDSEVIHLPHEYDCTKFYICSTAGEAMEMECGEGLSYDANESVCGYMSENCFSQMSSKPHQPMQQPSWQQPSLQQPSWQQPSWQQPSCQQQQPKPQPLNPQWPQYPSYPQQKPQPKPLPLAQPDYRCQNLNPMSQVYLPHPYDCSMYYMCDNGNAAPRSCPDGQHWNKMKNYCDWPQNAQCHGQFEVPQQQWQTPQKPQALPFPPQPEVPQVKPQWQTVPMWQPKPQQEVPQIQPWPLPQSTQAQPQWNKPQWEQTKPTQIWYNY